MGVSLPGAGGGRGKNMNMDLNLVPFIDLLSVCITFLMVTAVKNKLGYDDSLDAFGVHGAGGTLGAILTGVFATKEVNDLRGGMPMGLVDGNSGQVMNQLIASAFAWVIAIVGTLVILKIVDAIFGLRTTDAEETEGLDLSMHGEEGYHFEG